jgi:RNA polymerase sigma-70 factor (ECF subfamily)
MVRYTCGGAISMETPRHACQTAQDLFQQYGAGVYRFALVLLRHHQDAEDVLQETFLKLLRHVATGGRTDNVRAWLFTVAANAARDRQRRHNRWIPWASSYDPIVAPPNLPDEDGRLRLLRQTLQRLSARDRLLLVLRAQNLSYREIASAAGIRPTSVGRLLARALERWSRACAGAPATLESVRNVKPERHGLL